MSELEYNDLRDFIELSRKHGGVRDIEGADWNLEIHALTEAAAELLPDPPMFLFNKIKDYPAGYRALSLPIASFKNASLALGLPLDKSILENIRSGFRKIKEAKPIPPVEVKDAPVMENVITGDEVDILRFPAPLFHQSDGGRYIGTGDSLINRDPQSGYVNMGTYRMQIHERNLLGLWMSPGQQGRQICQRHWDQGKSCPVVATFGIDPLTFLVSGMKLPFGTSELDFVGGLRGRPMEVIKGPLTGLPIPAYAEIAIEGEAPPPAEGFRSEGPFGEWPGYYSGGTLGTGELQPVIRVKAVYFRNDPILFSEAPLWPGAPKRALPLDVGLLWDQLESAGIQDIVGVFRHTDYMIVVSIRQRYSGHAKQTGMAVIGCAAAARNGRYVVIVDEDIDPTNMKEVLWAMKTRVDPATDIEIIDGAWSTPLDPRMPPEKRKSGDYTNSRAIFYAVRPFVWRDKFPKPSRTERELRLEVVNKYKSILPFPNV
jgi:UbiD family decarboxylase